MNVPHAMKELRLKKKKSQKDIAKVLGITRPAYVRYETGNREPGLKVISELAEYYNVPPSVFFISDVKGFNIDKEQNIDKLYQFYQLRLYDMDTLIFLFQARLMEQQEKFAYDKQNDVSEKRFKDFVKALEQIHNDLERVKARLLPVFMPRSFEDVLKKPKLRFKEYKEWARKITS